jgi:hypothetical protein
MRQFIFVACALLASAGLAWAGSPTNPDWVRQQQGTTITRVYVSCVTTGEGSALLSATDVEDARRLTFSNNDTTNTVVLCPQDTDCDGLSDGIFLPIGERFTIGAAAQSTPWRCWASAGTAKVVVLIEK